MDPVMKAASTITRETIAAGIGLGAAATAAFMTKGARQLEQISQVPTQDVPQVLQMDSMAKEIQALEQEQFQNIWSQSQEFGAINQAAHFWTEEFVVLPPDLDKAWADSVNLPAGQEFLNASTWAEELHLGVGVGQSLEDTSLRATEFIHTVEQRLDAQLAGDWAREYEFEFNPQKTNTWADEFVTTGQNQKEEFWEKLQGEWDRLAAQETETHSWLTSSNSAVNQEYKFSDENPFGGSQNPGLEGKRLLEQGDIPNAVLAFEAAVQQNPSDVDSWVSLGKTQAQNEQDPMAISALNQGLRIQPANLGALLALGASLTNEAFQLQAAQALKNWLRGNPKYSHLIPAESASDNSRISSVVSKDELKDIQESFIEAARLHPRQGLDPDVQSGLGILFNLGSEYEKAADCFQAALSLRPNDSLLWNRLGATLANGGKSAEAISAYRRALELTPGFIRTRYNLGVSCINLGSYKEAAEHFLTALNQQAGGNKLSLMSDSIWNSLRMILHLMDRGDLTSAVDQRNLLKLNTEFNIK